MGTIVGYFFFVHLFDYSKVVTIKHDLVSWALPGHALNNGFGVLYRDYWNVNPPGVILLTHIWMTVFGVSGLSFQLLHFGLTLTCLLGMIRILKKVFPPYISAWLSITSSIVFLSPQILIMLAPSELNGLAFSLLAVNLLIDLPNKLAMRRKVTKEVGLATCLFVLSGQMKDPFVFTILAVIPFLGSVFVKYREKFLRVFGAVLIGGSLGIAVIVSYLRIHKSLSEYIQVFMAKGDAFLVGGPMVIFLNFNRGLKLLKLNIVYIPYLLPVFIGLCLTTYLILKVLTREFIFKEEKNYLDFRFKIGRGKQNLNYLILVFYSFGSLLGYSLQKRYGSHYDIQGVFPIIILISIPLVILFRTGHRWLKGKSVSKHISRFYLLLTSSLFLLLTLPKTEYFTKYSYDEATIPSFWSNIQEVKNPWKYELKSEIDSLIGPQDCIMNLYGWAVGVDYFYLERRPCTRFFIPNILPKEYVQEYGDALVTEPPRAILYRRGGEDMDVEIFESTVFDYTSVLLNCYEVNQKYDWLFLPKVEAEKLSECVFKNK